MFLGDWAGIIKIIYFVNLVVKLLLIIWWGGIDGDFIWIMVYRLIDLLIWKECCICLVVNWFLIIGKILLFIWMSIFGLFRVKSAMKMKCLVLDILRRVLCILCLGN